MATFQYMDKTSSASGKTKGTALPAAMMFVLLFILSFVTGLQNPLGVIVKEQFGASDLLSQLGNFANFIAYAFMGIPAGLMLRKFGYKTTALAALAVGLAGMATMWLSGRAASYGIYLCGAFISGFSMCMLNTTANPMLGSLGRGGRGGNRLIQFGGVFNSSGAALAPMLVGYLMGNTTRTISSADPALYLAMGIFAVTFIALSLIPIPEPAVTGSAAPGFKRSPMSYPHFAQGIAAIFVYVGVEVSIPNIGNLYMTDHLGMDPAMAGTIVGTYWLLMLAGRIFGGLAGSRVSPRAMLTCGACLALLFTGLAMLSFGSSEAVGLPVLRSDASFGIERLPIGLMFLILCGLATSVMWGTIFSLATSDLGKHTPAASGILMTMVCGGGILPAIQAHIADTTSYTASFWVPVAGFAYILFYALSGSRKKEC